GKMTAGAGIETRDLILVFVGEQFEPVARYRLGEAGVARRLFPLRCLCLPHERLIATSVAAALIADQEVRPNRNDFAQRAGEGRLLRCSQRGDRALDGRRVRGGAPTPVEGAL